MLESKSSLKVYPRSLDSWYTLPYFSYFSEIIHHNYHLLKDISSIWKQKPEPQVHLIEEKQMEVVVITLQSCQIIDLPDNNFLIFNDE